MKPYELLPPVRPEERPVGSRPSGSSAQEISSEEKAESGTEMKSLQISDIAGTQIVPERKEVPVDEQVEQLKRQYYIVLVIVFAALLLSLLYWWKKGSLLLSAHPRKESAVVMTKKKNDR
ncbi:TPA: hypothetical protein HA265_03075 [Candidatus Woesearchaeota archaeon]|nr:hypothetical protein [Candidatus Woesearchaeota archaeon]